MDALEDATIGHLFGAAEQLPGRADAQFARRPDQPDTHRCRRSNTFSVRLPFGARKR